MRLDLLRRGVGSCSPAGKLTFKAKQEEEIGLAHAGLQPLELNYVVHSNSSSFLLADSDKINLF